MKFGIGHLSIGPIPARRRIGGRRRAGNRQAGSYSGLPDDRSLTLRREIQIRTLPNGGHFTVEPHRSHRLRSPDFRAMT